MKVCEQIKTEIRLLFVKYWGNIKSIGQLDQVQKYSVPLTLNDLVITILALVGFRVSRERHIDRIMKPHT
jgi:hypothetical protein